MQAKLIITFDRLSEAAFLATAERISSALGTNAGFPQPWPAQVPAAAQLAADLTTYVNAYNAAKGGDKQKIAVRGVARTTLTSDLKRIAPYLEMVANGDTTLLMTTGYELRREVVKASAINGTVLPPPDDFRLSRGNLSGALIVHARKLEGAGSYEVQTTLTDPTVESNWVNVGTFMRCSKIELAGLVPGKTVSVRLRGIGSHSPGAWTPAATLMVV